MLFRWAAPVNPPTKKLNHPFDWGSSNQLNDRPQVTLTDGWAWASHPEECSVNGPVLSCNFTRTRTLMKPPPAPTSEKYELSIFPSGEFFGPPEDALAVSANVYLQ